MPLPSHPPKKGTILQQQLTEQDAVNGTLTFSTKVHTIEIYNTGDTTGIFNVNGVNISVPAGALFESIVGGEPSPNITATGTTSYIVSIYT